MLLDVYGSQKPYDCCVDQSGHDCNVRPLKCWASYTVHIAQDSVSFRKVPDAPGCPYQWTHKQLCMLSTTPSTILWSKFLSQPWGATGNHQVTGWFCVQKTGGSKTMSLVPPVIDRLDPFGCLGYVVSLALWHIQFACHGQNLSLPAVDRRHHYK